MGGLMKNNDGLPEGWKWKTLGEICSKPQYGWTTKANPENGTVKLLRTTDITSGVVDWSTVPYCTETPENLEKYLVSPGDIVISRAGSVGFSYLITNAEKAVFASYLIRFRPHDNVDRRYVYYYLKSPAYWQAIGASKIGIAVPNVNATKLSQISIPLALPVEQKLIVSEIEKQFSRLDEAVAALKRVRASLKRYKASVLKAAVEVRIVTSEQKKWKTTTVGEVSEIVTKGSSPNWQGFEYSSEGVVFVRSQNVSWGHLDLSDVAHLPLAFNKKEKKSVLRTGDVLLNIVGASIGRAAVASKSIEGGNINQAVAVIRPLRDRLLPQFLMCYFLSEKVQKLIHAQKVDVARANYSLEQIRKLPLHLPPLDDQHLIVEEIESRLSVAEEIEEIININLKRAERLRQAILKKAFSGRLV